MSTEPYKWKQQRAVKSLTASEGYLYFKRAYKVKARLLSKSLTIDLDTAMEMLDKGLNLDCKSR